MVETRANQPPRLRKEITQDIKTVREQLIALNPDNDEALELLARSFTRSGGEALAHNLRNPEDPQKPSEPITVDELYTSLHKRYFTGGDERQELLPKFQAWYSTMSRLMTDSESWTLLQRLVNLYHEGSGTKPVDPDILKQTLASTFLRGLKDKFGFNI